MASVAEAGPIVTRDRSADRRLVRVWLLIVALMIVAIVVVGGATRLTHAGLSITEWQAGPRRHPAAERCRVAGRVRQVPADPRIPANSTPA